MMISKVYSALLQFVAVGQTLIKMSYSLGIFRIHPHSQLHTKALRDKNPTFNNQSLLNMGDMTTSSLYNITIGIYEQ